MRRLRLATILAALCTVVVGLALMAGAQEEPPVQAEDPELEAALDARRESPDFRQRLEEFDAAQQAHQAAIASIPQVQALDEQIALLRQQIRALQKLRTETIEYYERTLAPYRSDSELSKEALIAADPVRQLLDRRRAEASEEADESTP